MKEQWDRLASRFDALGQRERILGFIVALVVLILVFQMLALDPLVARKKRLTQQLADSRQGLVILQQQVKTQQAISDPGAARRSHRDALRQQLADIDKGMGEAQRGLVSPERTARLLEEVLTRSRGLQLVSLRTLPVQRFDALASAPVAEVKGAPGLSKEAERVLYQHGFEITLQGSYAEVHDYLTRVEQLPWQMFWSRISVNTDQYPKLTVTLTVQTLSLSKAWLIV
jgi:MSHA biogenesis protein MshJ